jgi:CelD/BcsL family acetyltransferase involved in cellulose biosynthesis
MQYVAGVTQGADMALGCLDPTTDPLWATLVSQKRASLFHSPLWLGAVQDAYGFQIRACVVTDRHRQPVAGIPYACVDELPAPRLLAAPFCDTCDPLFEHPAEWDALLASLEAYRVPVHLRCLETDLPNLQRFIVTKRARWHTISLLERSEDRWLALDESTRRAIRKAGREGVQIRPLEPGPDLTAFHRLHVALRKSKYRLLAQPLAFFEAIARRFQVAGRWHALGAWIGDRLVAGTIYLSWGDTFYYKFNASAPDALDARPNDLLIWKGIELAIARGFRRFDLGPSDDDQLGLIRFKRQFGAQERELRFLRLDPPGWDDRPTLAAKGLLHDITRLMTRPEVSDEISAEAGALLYRYFA